MSTNPVVKILVVGPAWIGDMVMAQSLFKRLRQRYPSALIDVLAPAWSAPILQRMPEVHQCVEQPLGHGRLAIGRRYQLGKSLRSVNYDLAVVLPRSYKAALVPFFAKIKHRVGYRGELRYGVINDIRPLDKSVLTQTVQRFTALGEAPDAPLPPSILPPTLNIDRNNAERLLRELDLQTDKPVVGLMPGAEYGPAKCWPYYAQLARQLTQKDCYVWIFGSEKDRSGGDDIAQGNSQVRNLCGSTQLADAVDLLSLPQAVVCNDSGLMHIAAAVGQHVIAIYGSSTPDYTPPLSDKATVLYEGLECSPCFKRRCPLGHTNCLNNISVERVLSALDRIDR
ncbi:MAG: lipopolysaccharide heptosyltransferase II [Gammaproteobacteria bacterium]|nr:lipopolysaccharide heptosyltransferase II [Gammaproteobacteria bacterium]MDH5801753.1 lipopolysaccharide heptosyltransferase II [Gammaproteobacteria bacterium]